MDLAVLPAPQKRAYYDYLQKRRNVYRERAYKALGNSCTKCGSTSCLRVRFKKQDHPLRSKYRNNPTTLYRRLCLEIDLREDVILLCDLCRLGGNEINGDC